MASRTRIPFTIRQSNHLIIEALINDTKARLIVDTAAGATVINASQLDKFHLKVRANSRKGDVKGLGTSSHVMEKILPPRLQIGKLVVEDQKFISLDLNHVMSSHGRWAIHGLLGCDFLRKHDAIIDYGKKLISLTYSKAA